MKIYYKTKGLFNHTGSKWDLLSPSVESAIEYAHTYINMDPPRMIDEYHYSWEYFLAHSGESISTHFRTDFLDSEDISISEMIATHCCKTDLVLYRGVIDHIFRQMQQNATSLPGVDLFDKGFMSCSLVRGHELKSDHQLRIYVPAGSHVIYLGNVNDEQHFYEVVIQHGAKLRIIDMDSIYINCRLLSC